MLQSDQNRACFCLGEPTSGRGKPLMCNAAYGFMNRVLEKGNDEAHGTDWEGSRAG